MREEVMSLSPFVGRSQMNENHKLKREIELKRAKQMAFWVIPTCICVLFIPTTLAAKSVSIGLAFTGVTLGILGVIALVFMVSVSLLDWISHRFKQFISSLLLFTLSPEEKSLLIENSEPQIAYLLGDDGEIIEIGNDEKPKHGANSTVD
jgi:cytochrome c biogenesis factor